MFPRGARCRAYSTDTLEPEVGRYLRWRGRGLRLSPGQNRNNQGCDRDEERDPPGDPRFSTHLLAA